MENWILDPQWRSMGDLQSYNQALAVGDGLGKLSWAERGTSGWNMLNYNVKPLDDASSTTIIL